MTATSHDAELAAAAQRLVRLEAFLASDPGNGALRADTIRAAMRCREWGHAEQHLNALPPTERVQPAWCLHEAELRMAQKRDAEARTLLAALLERAAPGSELADVVTQNLAQVDFSEGAFGACVERLRPLMVAKPGLSIATHQLWLRALHREGLLVEACDWALQAERAGGLHAAAAGIAALAAVDHSRFDLAQRWAAIPAAPGTVPSMELLVARATVALAAQDASAGQRWAAMALQQNPDDGRAWSISASAAMLLADVPRAEQEFGQAVELMPAHLGSWHGLGWAQVLQGKLAEARATFEHAVALDRNFGESHGGLAVVLAMQGDAAGAQQHVELAKRLDPEGLAWRYAEAVLRGEGKDLEVLRKLAGRVIGRRG